jgi:hypothetical protein
MSYMNYTKSNRSVILPALTFICGLVVVDSGRPESPSGLPPELAKIASVYRIEIVCAKSEIPGCFEGPFKGVPADRAEIAKYSQMFTREFSLYPPDLVKRCRLKRVVLCKELSLLEQKRTAIPYFDAGVLYLDVCRGSYNPGYVCKVLHHEFFHIIDYFDDGILDGDDRWCALNPPGFKYGSGGRNAQDIATTSVLTDKFPGFLNHYSTTAVEEDKAEVFANLIAEAAYVESRIKKDPVLRAKVTRMKELTASFCPEVNAAFWEKARKIDRKETKPNP